MHIQDLLATSSYARVQKGFDEERFLDVEQMHVKPWSVGSNDYLYEGGMSACKDFESLMHYIATVGMPEDYDTLVLFDGYYMDNGEDAGLGEVIVYATRVEQVIKIADIEGYDEYLDNLLGW